MTIKYPDRSHGVNWNVDCECGHLKEDHMPGRLGFGFHRGSCDTCMCPKFKIDDRKGRMR